MKFRIAHLMLATVWAGIATQAVRYMSVIDIIAWFLVLIPTLLFSAAVGIGILKQDFDEGILWFIVYQFIGSTSVFHVAAFVGIYRHIVLGAPL